MTIDLHPSKPQMAAILKLFLNETSKITTSFRNEFNNKNHVEMRYYNKIDVKYLMNYNFNMAFDGHFEFLRIIKEDLLNIS